MSNEPNHYEENKPAEQNIHIENIPGSVETPSTAQLVSQQASFEGPLPHPALLKGYDEIVPGAAERILKMAEEDAEHQRVLERDALKAAASDTKRGQNYGLLAMAMAMSCSMFALYLDHDVVAGIIGGTTVVGIVSAFVIGRKQPQSTK